MIEKQNMEASSSQTAKEKDLDIKEIYKQIKKKNEEIKSEIYFQFLKRKQGNENRLLKSFDYSIKKMIMSFLQPTTSAPKTMADYKNLELEVDNEYVHELDQIEFRRHSFEMLYSNVVKNLMSATKLQNTFLNM